MDERELMMAVVDAAEALTAISPLPFTWGTPGWDLLQVLNDRIANLRNYQIYALEADTVPVRTKPCEECGVAIFFALDVSGRWMPLEVDQVDAEEVTPGLRWVVDFDRFENGKRQPSVRFGPAVKGKVFVDHRMTCGAGKGPKQRCVGLVRRWKVNMVKAEKVTDALEAQLLAMADRLSERHGADADEKA